jgi:hypothetical protein
VWVVLGCVAVVALRVPYLHTGLTRDEGGDTLVANAFTRPGPFLYGSYFLDRPPLLLALYGAASGLGGDLAIRWMGTLAAVADVVAITAVAVRLAGPRSAAFAATAAAVVLSSQATGAEQTPAELLASVPSCVAGMLLVVGSRRPDAALRMFVGAGMAAGAAILIKQSFADAAVAAGAALAVGLVGDRQATVARARIAAFAGGLAGAAAALAIWAWAAGATAHEVWYAMFGFRLAAVRPLAAGAPLQRLVGLVSPALHSGLLPAAVAAVVGTAILRGFGRVLLATWLAVGGVAIVLSGSYFPPYLIELMAGSAVGVAVVGARWPRVGVAVLCVMAATGLPPTLRAAIDGAAGSYQRDARTLGGYVAARAERGQSVYVLYARANVLYYAGLPSPFPYAWALMMRTVPGAEGRLRSLLASARRPTWIVQEGPTTRYGLDRSRLTAQFLRRYYRVAGRICGHRVLLARGAAARPAKPTPRGACAHGSPA